MPSLTVFTLSSGRSGTMSLYEMLRTNAPDCTVVHEPSIWDRRNPSMFGRSIYDYAVRNDAPIRKLLATKRRAIERMRTPLYVETSHAFLKSYWELAPEYFPDMKVIHLVRRPLEVARSEANREAYMNKWRTPVRNYRGRDWRPYARWALTGLEPIFQAFAGERLTLFQRYVIQWIEVENRAMAFLQRFNMHDRCLMLHTPGDLNDPQTVHRVLDFIGLGVPRGEPSLPGVQNVSPGLPTIIGDAERDEFRSVIQRMPDEYLSIFRGEPYHRLPWVDLLRK